MKKEIMIKICKSLLILNTSIFIISFSFAFIILFRPFYYANIRILKLEEKTGYNYNIIKEAYDDVMDYTVLNKEFKVGQLKYSENGKSHFSDCRKLFILDFIILSISIFIFIIKTLFFNNLKAFNHSLDFISGFLNILIMIIILLISFCFGFNKLFVIFHNIFFMGKSNWLFDPDYDEIINILPIEFFINCAIVILLMIAFMSLFFIILDLLNNKKQV